MKSCEGIDSLDIDLEISCDLLESPIGFVEIMGSKGCLVGIHLCASDQQPRKSHVFRQDIDLMKETRYQLESYFSGELTSFDLPIDPNGTPFQIRVWRSLLEIPYGETWSYGELARRVGNSKAARAVGLANNRNPISIVIPCHRVIGSDGTLKGYGGGVEKKSYLLELERSVASARQS